MSATLASLEVRGEVRAADFVLARLGGAPACRLDTAILRATVLRLQRALACEAERAAETPVVETALYRLVPHLAESLRRRVLDLRRCVRNDGPRDAALVAEVATLLTDARERHALREWQRLSDERDHHLAAAAALHGPELAAAVSAVRTWLDDPMLRRGVALASPGLIEALNGDRARPEARAWRPSGRLARSCVSYYVRAAMKTSPFSTLTQVDLWPMGTVTPIVPAHAAGSTAAVRLARMVPMTWLELIARDPSTAPALSFELNPSLMNSRHVLRGHFVLHEAFAWRDESREALDPRVCDPPLLDRLRGLGPTFTFAALFAALAQSPWHSSTHDGLRILLDADVVRPVAPFSRAEVKPARCLARTVAGLGTPRAIQLGEAMHHVADAVDACETASATKRLALLQEVRTHSLHLCASLGGTSPTWSNRRSLVYENSRWSGPVAELPPAVRTELQEVVRAARARMVRSTLARFICRHFLECFGAEGEAPDVLGFLTSFVDRDDFTELVARALAEDHRALTQASSSNDAGAAQAPATVTVYFQIAARDHDSIQRGDFTLVVNQIGSGYGGLLGRFSDVLDVTGTRLRQRLHAWLSTVRPDSVLLETPIVNDWSNLHPVVGAGDELLRWPGEVAVTDDGEATERRLSELSLRASAANEELYFVDRHGRRMAPVYLGVTPTERIGGVRGLLLLLMDPWVSDHSLGRRLRRLASSDSADQRIEHFPRQVRGRVVFQRAQWRVPVACLPRQVSGEGDFAFLVRLERWRQAEGLPEEAFAECEETDTSAPGGSKPTWVHFHSPHTYSVLTAAIGPSTGAVHFTEVLPGRDHHWCTATAGSRLPEDRRVSEFLALGSINDPPVTEAPRRTPSYVSRPSDREWLYFRIYPGSISLLDETVRSVVGPVIEEIASAVTCWFFVRYIDERGPHLRLRVRPRLAHPTLADELRGAIAQRLENVSSGPVRRPLISMRAQQAALGWRGVTASPYRPEYVKYGGAEAMDVIEQWFERSSTIARQLLAEPFDPATAAAFMRSSAPAIDEERFWEHYLWHWTGQYEASAAHARAFLLREARKRRMLFGERLAEAMARPSVLTLLDAFGAATADVIHRLCELTTANRAASVRFDLVHMHNNRLGIAPIEEAYLAGLLISR